MKNINNMLRKKSYFIHKLSSADTCNACRGPTTPQGQRMCNWIACVAVQLCSFSTIPSPRKLDFPSHWNYYVAFYSNSLSTSLWKVIVLQWVSYKVHNLLELSTITLTQCRRDVSNFLRWIQRERKKTLGKHSLGSSFIGKTCHHRLTPISIERNLITVIIGIITLIIIIRHRCRLRCQTGQGCSF